MSASSPYYRAPAGSYWPILETEASPSVLFRVTRHDGTLFEPRSPSDEIVKSKMGHHRQIKAVGEESGLPPIAPISLRRGERQKGTRLGHARFDGAARSALNPGKKSPNLGDRRCKPWPVIGKLQGVDDIPPERQPRQPWDSAGLYHLIAQKQPPSGLWREGGGKTHGPFLF